MGDALFREHGRQVAALCWRAAPTLQVLLVTSLSSRRWILPNGWIEADLTPAQSAAREAFEEAGVTGPVSAAALGTYYYLKERKGSGLPCSVEVFALNVTQELEDWPEKAARQRQWLPLETAAAKVSEPGLREILHSFRGASRLPGPEDKKAASPS